MGNSHRIRRRSSDKNKEEPYVPAILTKKTGISYAICSDILANQRQHSENSKEDQTYSYVHSIPSFSEFKGNREAHLDLCILGNKNVNSDSKAKQKDCQDEVVAFQHGKDHFTIGVFDGHGQDGHKVAKSCVVQTEDLLTGTKSKVGQEAKPLPDYNEEGMPASELGNDPGEFLKQTISNLHQTVTKGSDFSTYMSGATATLATISDKKLHLSWVGDSKAVLFVTTNRDFSDLKAFNVTSMHNLRTEEEKERIKAAGGMVSAYGNLFGRNVVGTPRVFHIGREKPGLMLSKSIGDEDAQSLGVTHEADVLEIDFDTFETIDEMLNVIPDEFNAPKVDSYTVAYKAMNGASPEKVRRKGGNILMKTLDRLKRIGSSKNMSKDSLAPSKIGDESSNSLDKSAKGGGFLRQLTMGGRKKQGIRSSNISSSLQIINTKGVESDPTKDSSVDMASSFPENSTGNIRRASKSLFEYDKSPIKHAVLMIASDGIWEIFPKDEVAQLMGRLLRARGPEGPQENISLEICLQAQENWKGYYDNTGAENGKIDDISAVTAVLF